MDLLNSDSQQNQSNGTNIANDAIKVSSSPIHAALMPSGTSPVITEMDLQDKSGDNEITFQKAETQKPNSAPRLSGAFAQPSGAFAQPSGAFAQPSGAFAQPSGAFAQPSGDNPVFAPYATLLGHELVDDYRIGDQIGRGGCAIVYEAWRISDDLHVVIKVLHSTTPLDDQEADVAVKRFIREAKLISSLNEKHIVQCVDYGCFQGTPCMVLEFVEGLSLDQLLIKYGTLPLQFATGIIEQLLSALTETHTKGIIHRDIKPSNIMVFDSPPPFEIRVLDFGISTVLDNLQSQTLMTQQGSVRGTPSYMAPELFTGEQRASVESDLFAVGLVYLECLTGHPAVIGENFIRVAYKQVNEQLDVPGSIPPGIANIIEKLCAKDIEERYHSAQCVLDDIHANIEQALKDEEKCEREWRKGAAKREKAQKKLKNKKTQSLMSTTHDSLPNFQRRLIIILIALILVISVGLIGGYFLLTNYYALEKELENQQQPAPDDNSNIVDINANPAAPLPNEETPIEPKTGDDSTHSGNTNADIVPADDKIDESEPAPTDDAQADKPPSPKAAPQKTKTTSKKSPKKPSKSSGNGKPNDYELHNIL